MENADLFRNIKQDLTYISPVETKTVQKEDDDYGLPFEAFDEYSDAPLEFEELALMLWENLNELYVQAVRYNRHSPHYHELCDHLEKNIRLFGSMCVTKAVLEQKDLQFPALEGMSVKELYSMVSLHFRKCSRAFREWRDSGEGLDMGLLDRIFRWAVLAERLKATEEKIRNIRSGKINADRQLERAEIFRGEPRGSRSERRAIGKLRSLPVIKSFARELVREKKQHEAEIRRTERELLKEAEYPAFMPSKAFRPDPSVLTWPGWNPADGEMRLNGMTYEEWLAMEEPLPPEEEEEQRKAQERRRKKKR